MKNDIVQKSIEIWGLDTVEINFITQRENHMYNVITKDSKYCLRLHRKGLRSRDEIYSELLWVNMIRESGIIAPEVIPSLTGNNLHEINGIVVDLLSWLPGQQMAIKGEFGHFDNFPKIYYQLGRTMAELHNVSDNWKPPKGFIRPVWNREGILGENPIWGKFWENHCLYFTDKCALLSVKHQADEVFETCKNELDYGLIHADVIPDNVLINNDHVALANFGDGGFGYRLFDIATILNRTMHTEDYEQKKAALLKGYRSKRPLDDKHLLLFQALRSFTYLGWIMTRLNEPKGAERCKRFVEEACHLAGQYLAKS